MDLQSEASSNGRVLAARHITQKTSYVEDNAINTTLLCNSMDLHPDFETYSAGLQSYAPVLWSTAGALLLAIFLIFALSLRSVFKKRPENYGRAAFILAVYPAVAATAFLTSVVPRARVPLEAVAQECVMLAMYQLFRLTVDECGGFDQLVRRAEGARLETRVMPCCCWPCCIIPRPLLHKNKLVTLRYLVLQMAIIQAILYTFILVLWAESEEIYTNFFLYFQPFVAASILSGVWGMVMCIRAAESAGARPRVRFFSLQLALIIVKLQGSLIKLIPIVFNMPCLLPLHPSVFLNLIHNLVMIVEMLLLSIWAWSLYTAPSAKLSTKVQTVAVMEDHSNTLSSIRQNGDSIEARVSSGDKQFKHDRSFHQHM